MRGRERRLQFQHAGDRLAVVERIVQLNDARMVQAAHDLDFAFHRLALLLQLDAHEFGGQLQIGGLFLAHVDGAVSATEMMRCPS